MARSRRRFGEKYGQPSPADVRRLMGQVVPKIRAAGINVGVGCNNPADAAGIAEFIKLGANFVTVSAQGLQRLGPDGFLRRVDAELT